MTPLLVSVPPAAWTATVLVNAVLVTAVLVTAVLMWPAHPGSRSTRAAAEIFAIERYPCLPEDGGGISGGPATGSSRAAGLWRADPVALWRFWRAQRRPADLEAEALVLLDACVPALQAGLTPVMALQLAASSTPGTGGASGASSSQLSQFLTDLASAHATGAPPSQAWVSLATRSGSAPIGFVAGAWRLSETTGAPLAVAASRAATGLRDLQARRRRVAVAVAGPRATVLVLTVLPLTGPLFGLACGLSPAQLYLGSPLALASVGVGLVLAGLGRLWCRRLIRTAVGP